MIGIAGWTTYVCAEAPVSICSSNEQNYPMPCPLPGSRKGSPQKLSMLLGTLP